MRVLHDAAGVSDPATESGGILTIDVGAIVENWRALSHRAGSAECAGVVKADAYGCGAAVVAPALARAGCRTFFVATLGEARTVRRALGEGPAIYVLGGVLPGTAPRFAEIDARPVLSSLAQVEEWRGFVDATHWHGTAALHVDTGMNRLGLSMAEAHAFAGERQRPILALLMSHLACADTPEHPLNAQQRAAFREVRALYPDVPASLANSSGIFLGADAAYDLVRPGAALYGVNPTPAHPNPMRAVVHLAARIVQVRSVPAGQSVGYGAAWQAQRDSRIAVIAAGYADGILRAAGGSDAQAGAAAIVGGRHCPFAGRVSMDLIAIDVTGVEPAPRAGDLVTLLGDEIGVDDLAAAAGTIGYEVLTALGQRYHRIYRA